MDPTPTRPKVLVAEDNPAMRQLLGKALRDAGYDVVEVQDGVALWKEIHESLADDDNPREPDLVVSDIRMPGQGGLEVLARLRAANWTTPVILITAFADMSTVVEAMQLGATLVLSKPFELQRLVAAALSLVDPA